MISKQFKAEVVKVTPKMAKQWLAKNDANRNVRHKLISAYRRDMEHGKWTFTAEPIQFSTSGRLLNGQHRLTALATSEGVKHIEMLVASGLPEEAQEMMDQGKPRNIRDALLLAHGDMKNITLVSGVAKIVHLSPEPGPHLTPSLMRTKITTAEALDVVGKNPDIGAACERGNYMRAYLDGSPTGISYTSFVLNRVDPEAADRFFKGIATMEWDYKNDPRKAAIQRMRYMHRTQGVKTSMETTVILISVLTRAWNAWRKQEEVEQIMAKGRLGLVPPVRPV